MRRAMAATAGNEVSNEPRCDVMDIDDCDVAEAQAIAAAFGSARYGYLVTANVDHVIRHYLDANFRILYASASYVLLDSRFLVHVLRLLKGQMLRASPGSDLTNTLFENEIAPNDRLVVAGGTAQQAQMLRERYGLKCLHHIDPPMNLARNPKAIEACVAEIEAASPFRFCFVAVGSPQQEIISYKLKERRIARGLALCVGSAINFMTGVERRAPAWMQQAGCEWAFRLLQQPRRMAHRYLIRGPSIFWLASRVDLRLRRPTIVTQPQQTEAESVETSELGTEEQLLRAAGLP
jgi:exopolysaccharide biosynthesis WecB/TagA/CpsF family protein